MGRGRHSSSFGETMSSTTTRSFSVSGLCSLGPGVAEIKGLMKSPTKKVVRVVMSGTKEHRTWKDTRLLDISLRDESRLTSRIEDAVIAMMYDGYGSVSLTYTVVHE